MRQVFLVMALLSASHSTAIWASPSDCCTSNDNCSQAGSCYGCTGSFVECGSSSRCVLPLGACQWPSTGTPTSCGVDGDCPALPFSSSQVNRCVCPGQPEPSPLDCTQDNNPCTLNDCKPSPNSTLCRAAADVCDVDEFCTGLSTQCPSDQLASASVTCRTSAGECDVPETCSGASANCPADQLKLSGAVCRQSTDACDPAETCSGGSSACPDDAKLPDETSCADSNLCDTDVCQSGQCRHTAIPCQDLLACTADSCEPSVGCRHLPVAIQTPCDRSNQKPGVCDGQTSCVECVANADCPSGKPFCEPSRNLCVPCLEDGHCDDNNACTQNVCAGFVCTFPNICSCGETNSSFICHDWNECTIEACYAQCQYTPKPALTVCSRGRCNGAGACMPTLLDNDRDGLEDDVDRDADQDGFSNVDEGGGLSDLDNDGTPDYADADTPGFLDENFDGIDDRLDVDRDGLPHALDLDSDGDGATDLIEVGLATLDADLDGRVDSSTDVNRDGLMDAADSSRGGVDAQFLDVDQNGVIDVYQRSIVLDGGTTSDAGPVPNPMEQDGGATSETPDRSKSIVSTSLGCNCNSALESEWILLGGFLHLLGRRRRI